MYFLICSIKLFTPLFFFFGVGLRGQPDQLTGLNVFTDIQHFRWELRRMFYSVTEKLDHCSFSFPVSPYRSIGGNEGDSRNNVDHFCRLLCKIGKHSPSLVSVVAQTESYLSLLFTF